MIHILSNETINKIAAGEVIENPASVIKELVENSIDAKANSITIEIKGGGFHLIRITDNGCGMTEEDSVVCFQRHATSKISTIDDLNTLQSMGFRGEALSSIAAISKITLTTAKEGEIGTKLDLEGGKILSQTKTSHPKGTRLEIRSLFYNTPARKKFQKHPSASATEIHKLIVLLSLSHPHVGFTLVSNEETLIKISKNTQENFQDLLETRISSLFKNSFLHSKLPMIGEQNGYRLQGFLGLPTENRHNRTGQYLFVNQRAVISPQISYGIKEGFGQRLDTNRYPVFILHLTVSPHLLDVNVHPQKKEVRFAEGAFLFRFIKEMVQKAFSSIAPKITPPFQEPLFPSWEKHHLETPPSPIVFPRVFQGVLQEEKHHFTPHPTLQQEKVIALFHHYLLLDGSTITGFEAGVVLVHLLKVRELILWENLLENKTPSCAQGLLIPISIEVTATEAKEMENRKKELNGIGFVFHSSGKHTFFIEAIPSFLEEADITDSIRLVIQSDDPFPLLAKTITRFALRRKKKFTMQEALSLWEIVKEKKTLHGITLLKMDEIEKFFI